MSPTSPNLEISSLIDSVNLTYMSIKALSMYYQNAKGIVEEHKSSNYKEKIIQKWNSV